MGGGKGSGEMGLPYKKDGGDLLFFSFFFYLLLRDNARVFTRDVYLAILIGVNTVANIHNWWQSQR